MNSTNTHQSLTPAKSLIGEADCGDPGFIRLKSALLRPFEPDRTLGFFRPTPHLAPKWVQGQVPGAGLGGA